MKGVLLMGKDVVRESSYIKIKINILETGKMTKEMVTVFINTWVSLPNMKESG